VPADAVQIAAPTVNVADEYDIARNGGDQQKAGRSLRVLLAEDNLVNQQLVARLLQRRGHKVVVVNTGREALEAFDLLPFDMVLMDVQMPEMDGLEATAAIRRREAGTGKHVPIVALTAYAMKGDRESCLSAGMDRYISKPIRAQELFEAVEGDVSSPATGGDLPLPIEPGSDIIDRTGALARVGNNLNLLAELAGIFLKECPRLLDEIRSGLAAGDARKVGSAAHSLKGAIDNFSARPSFEVALRLETICRNGNLGDGRTVLADLERELHRLMPVISRLAAGGC
jgi:two-component system sensor histidine kinase/response regulator